MIKLLAVIIVLHQAACQIRQDLVQTIFQDKNDINTVGGLQCFKLEGTSGKCLACYPCDHSKIESTKLEVHNIAFTFSNCTRDRLCCIEAEELTGRSADDDCGIHNPQGNPLRRRSSLRSVLEREYPWRAWVYSSTNEQPLCAASYINYSVKALLTTASCVKGHNPSDLLVKFTKTQEIPYHVSYVVPHENFTVSKGGNINDLVVLTLKEEPDKAVQSVCLNFKPALVGASCVLVSDSETYINRIIPQEQKCKNKNVTVENNVMCTFMIKHDYMPQRGAGLYCLNELSKEPRYDLKGIYQADQSNDMLSLYTNISKYVNWIINTTDHLKKLLKVRS